MKRTKPRLSLTRLFWAPRPLVLLLVYGVAWPAQVLAAPQGEKVVHGKATFVRDGTTTTIHASDKAIIDYQKFGIGRDETVEFVQPSEAARVLNRVTGFESSQIDGSLRSNGIVYLLNPQGIFFGSEAIVDVGGMVAAAGHMSNDDFMKGIDHFTQLEGTVANAGDIHGRVVSLLGRHVTNMGAIRTESGVIAMVAGDEIWLGALHGHVMVKMNVSEMQDGTGIQNTGTLDAGKGRVSLAAGDMYAVAAQLGGTVRGKDLQVAGGENGLVEVTGTLDASDRAAGQSGGKIEVTGDRIALREASLDASGDAGGGTIHVGGEFQGKGTTPTASRTYVSKGSTLRADAETRGDGGEVVVWADEITGFAGHASARGGSQAGDGGMIEVSGKQTLLMRGTADTRAPAGKTGMLLLDPQDITISDEDDGDGSDDDQIGVSDGTVLETDGTPPPTNNFTISAGALEGVSATTSISLSATRDITVADLGSGPADEILNLQTGSSNSVTFTADADNAGGGNFSMADIDDTIQTAGGSLTIVGEDVTVGFLTTNGGAVTLDAKGGTATIERTIDSGNGTILVRGDDIDIDTSGTEGFLNSGTATTTLRDADGDGIELGGADVGGRFNLNDDEVDNITAALIKLETTGDVEVEGITTSRAVSIDPVLVTFAADASFGALTVEADNGITIDPNVTVTTAGTTIMNADFVPGDDNGAFTVGADATLTTTNNPLTITADEIVIDVVTVGDEGTVTSGTAATTIVDSDADGINLNPAADVAGDLNLTNAEIARITANGGLTFRTAGTITATGVTTAAAQGAVTLDAATLENVTNTGQVVFSTAASTFFGALTVRADDGIDAQQDVTSNGTTILDADNDTDGTGDFSIAATRTLSTTDDVLTITANDVVIDTTAGMEATVTSGTAATTIVDSDGTGIGLGATAVANGLNLSGAELQRITASGLTLQTAGAVTVDGITEPNSDTVNTVTLDTATTIAFTGAASTFDGLVAQADAGISVAQDITTDTSGLSLDGDADNNLAGTVAFTGLRTLDAAGTLALDGGTAMSGTAGLNLLGDAGVTLTRSLTTNGATVIDADNNADGTGDFSVATGQTIATTNNALTVTANDIALSGSLNSGTAATTIVDSNNTGINLNPAVDVPGDLNLSNAELALITSNGLVFRTGETITATGATTTATQGAVTFDAATVGAAGQVLFSGTPSSFLALTANADNGVQVNGNVTTTGGNLTLNGDFDASAAGTVNFGGARTLDSAGILTLTGATAMTGTAGLNLISDDGVVFAQSLTTNGATAIDADNDTDGTGDFSLALGQTVATTNGTLSVTANDVQLLGSLNSGTAATTIIDSDDDGINLNPAADVAGDLNLSNTELGQITSNGLTLRTGGTIAATGVMTGAGQGAVTLDATTGTTGQVAFSGTPSTFAALTANADNGIAVNVDLTTTAGNLALDGDADNSAAGTVVFGGAGVRTLDATAGSITLNGGTTMTTGAATGLVLTADDGVTLSESLTTNGITTIDADDDANDNIGTFTVATGETLSTTNNALSVTANDVDLAGSINSGTAATTIVDSDATGIGLGATPVANGLNVSGAELQRVTASALTLQTAGPITVDGITAANSDNVNTVTLDTATTISFTGTASTFDGLLAQADAGISVGADVATDTSGLSLDGDADNNMAGTVAFTGTRTVDATGVLTLDGGTAMTGTLGLNLIGDDGVVFAQSLTTNGATAIDADNDTDGTGDFSLALGQTVATTNGTLSVTANDVQLLGSLNSGTAATTIIDSDNTGINLNPAADVAGDLNLSNTELGQITSNGLTLRTGGTIAATGVMTGAGQGAVTLDATTGTTGQVAFSGTPSTFAALTANADNGIAVNVDLTTTAGNLALDGDADNSAAGTVVFGGAGVRTLDATAGSITLNGGTTMTTGAATGLVLTADDGVTLSESLTTNGITTIDADDDANDNIGTFTVATGETLSTTNNALSVTANDVDLAGSINSGTAATTIVDSDATGIGLGATPVANGLNVSGAELQRVTASALTLQTAGPITVDGITAANSDNVNTVTLDTATTISFTGTASTFDGLLAQADAGISVGADVATDTSGLSLDGDADNNLAGTVAFTGTRTLDAAGILTLDGGTAMTGTLGLNLIGDDGVVFAQSLTTNGATAIDADNDTDGTGDFSLALGQTVATTNGTLSVTANDVQLLGSLNSGTAATTIIDSDNTGINLNPAADVAGDLNLTNTELGQITSNGLTLRTGGAITATGATTTATQGAVTLDATTGVAGNVLFAGTASSFASLTVNADAGTQINADVTTTGAQNYADNTTLGGPALRTLTASQVTFGSSATDTLTVNTDTTVAGPMDVNATTTLAAGLTANAGAGANTIDGTVDGAAALALNAGAGGSNAINAEVGGTTALTTVATTGTTAINADITTTGTQTYDDDVTIAGAAPRTLTASAVRFGDDPSTDTLTVNQVTTVDAPTRLLAATTLTADLTLNAGTGSNTLDATVDGAAALFLNGTGAGGTAINFAIGGTTPLTTVSATGGVGLNADVTTTGAQSYADTTVINGMPRTLNASQVTFGDAPTDVLDVNAATVVNAPTTLNASTTLDADLTINAGTGATTIGALMFGANDLTLNSSGAGSSTINGPIGDFTPLATVSTTGTTAINANVTTTGTQTYADNTTIAGTAPRTLAGSQVSFGDSAADALAVNTATTLNGPVDVNATTTLAADLTANAGAGANTIDGTVNGAGALALNSSGAGSSAINAAIGGTTALTSVSTTGTTTIDADVRTSGAQTYADNTTIAGAAPRTFTGNQVSFGDSAADTLAVNTATTIAGALDLNATTTLAANLTANAGAGATTIDGTVDGAAALALNSTGAGSSAINAAVGGIAPLTTVATSGTTAISADVTTSGAQTYADNTTIGGAAPRTLSASQVTFGDATADTLAVNTATTVNAPMDVNATTTLAASLAANAGAGANTIDATVNGAAALALNSTGAGSSAINAALGGTTPLSSVSTTGTTTINADVQTSGAQTYADNTTIAGAAPRTLTGSQVTFGDTAADTLAVNTATIVNGPLDLNAATTLAANLTANAGAGATTIDGTVNGAAALALTSTGAGSSAINAAIGGTTPLTSVATTGTTAINADVRTSGAQTYADDTTIAGAAPRTLTASQVTFGDAATDALAVDTATTVNGPVDVNATTTLAADLTANAGAGANRIDGTVDGAGALVLNSTGAGSNAINAAIGGATPLASVATTGTTAINANVTTTGAQTYADNTAIAGAAPRTLTGSQVSFGDTAADTLAVNTATTLNGPVDVNATTTLAASLTANAGAGATTIDGTVNGAAALALNSTGAGSSAINAAIGGTTPLASVTTSGTTAINADVRTSGAQTYADNTTIAGAAPRTFTGSQVSFGDSAADTLAVNTATTIAGPLDLNATTTLAANLTANVGAGATTIDGPINGAAVLALNATGAGRSTINAAIGATVPLSAVTTTGNTTLAADVTTSGDQTYTNALTIGSDSVVTSTGAGNLRFASTVSGGAGLTANTAGTTTFVGAVDIEDLTTDAGGTTAINGGRVTTDSGQQYGDAVTLGANTTLTSGGASNIALADTLNGPFALTVDTGGVASFRGDIGGLARLTTFETEPVGTILFGANVDLFADTVRFGTSSGDNFIRPANAATVAGEGDLSLNATTFAMGRGEKLTVAGDLAINAGSARLSDINALTVNVNAGSIALLSRPAGSVILTTVDANGNSLGTPAPADDDGMDIVANSIRFSSIPTIAPLGTQTFSVVLSTANGSDVTGAVPTDQKFAQRAIFSTLRPLTRADLEGPVAGGIPSDTAPDLLGRGVVVSGCLDCQNSSLINQDETSLWDLAEAPEPPPTPDEVLAFLNECDPETDPTCEAEAGEGEAAPLGNEAALDAQELYRELVKSKGTTDRVGPVLQAGVEHCRQSGAGGGTALRSCLASNAEYADAVGYLDRLELLFAQFTKLGLAPGGLQSMREEILTEIINVLSLEGITPQDLGEAIGPNAALPEGGTGV